MPAAKALYFGRNATYIHLEQLALHQGGDLSDQLATSIALPAPGLDDNRALKVHGLKDAEKVIPGDGAIGRLEVHIAGAIVVGEVKGDNEVLENLHTLLDLTAHMCVTRIEADPQPPGPYLLYHLPQLSKIGARMVRQHVLQPKSHSQSLRDRKELLQAVQEQGDHSGNLLLPSIGTGVDDRDGCACQGYPLQDVFVVLYRATPCWLVEMGQIVGISKGSVH